MNQEWIHNPENNIMLSGKAFSELCINKQAFVYNIKRHDNQYYIESGFKSIKFKPHDVTVYLYVLQLCSTSKYTLTSGYHLGRYLNYPVREKNGYKECQKASGSISRLRQTGYLVYLPSFHEGKMIPLVRVHKGKIYGPGEGFEFFCNSSDRSKAFRKFGIEDEKSENLEWA